MRKKERKEESKDKPTLCRKRKHLLIKTRSLDYTINNMDKEEVSTEGDPCKEATKEEAEE